VGRLSQMDILVSDPDLVNPSLSFNNGWNIKFFYFNLILNTERLWFLCHVDRRFVRD
jgi:hypothetical protein